MARLGYTAVFLYSMYAEGIAVDWINTKLYWTDTEMKTVEVLDLSGGYHTALISTGIGSSSMPQAIVVDPQTR